MRIKKSTSADHSRRVSRASSAFLILIWAFCIAQGILFIVSTPLWDGFDEPFHYAYIQTLAESRHFPTYGKSLISKEITESFRYIPLSADVNSNLGRRYSDFKDYWKLSSQDRAGRAEALRHIPPDYRRQPDFSDSAVSNYEAQHPPLYYLFATVPYVLFSQCDLPTRIIILRFFSLLMGSLTLVFAYSTAKFVWNTSRKLYCIPILITLMPMFISTVSRISNDSLGVMIYSLMVLLAVRCFISGPTTTQAALLGVVTGLGLLTKAYFLTVIPALFVLFLSAGDRRQSMIKRLGYFSICALGFILAAGWWYWRNYKLYGNMSGLQTVTLSSALPVLEYLRYVLRVPWLENFHIMFREHIWIGNSSFISLSRTVYWCGFLIIGVSAAGIFRFYVPFLLNLGRRLFHRVRPGNAASATGFEAIASGDVLHIHAMFFIFFIIGLCYDMFHGFIITQRPGNTGGWYLYAVVVAELMLLSYGFEYVPWVGRKARGQMILIIYGVLLSFLGYFCKAIPFYSGFVYPRFHLWHFIEIYSPGNFVRVLENLSIGKASFITPLSIGVIIIVYLVLAVLVLQKWFGLSIDQAGNSKFNR